MDGRMPECLITAFFKLGILIGMGIAFALVLIGALAWWLVSYLS